MRTTTSLGSSSGRGETIPTPPDVAAGDWLRARSLGSSTSVSISTNSASVRPFAGATLAVTDHDASVAAQRAIESVDLTVDRRRMPVFKVQGMEKWEGRIVEIDESVFSAELEPNEPDGERVTADFSVDLLAPETDIQPGDLIYVTARTVVDRPGYPRTRTVNVRLRRTGHWTAAEASAIQARAVEAKRRFDALFG